MNKHILITGATSGIGYESAMQLAEQGNRISIIARSKEKAEHFSNEFFSKFKIKPNIYIADLANFSEIRKIVIEIKLKEKIDVLLNNAGALFDNYQENEQSVELTMATNHFGPFLLTNLLLDHINEGARIINVSSMAHSTGRIDLKDINQKANFSAFQQYGNSKLANILFTNKLAINLKNRKITVNSLHPGVIRSNFANNTNGIFGMFFKVFRPFLTSPKLGAKTSVYLCSSREVQDMTGKYFSNCKEAKVSKFASDTQLVNDFWELSERLTNLKSS